LIVKDFIFRVGKKWQGTFAGLSRFGLDIFGDITGFTKVEPFHTKQRAKGCLEMYKSEMLKISNWVC